MNRFSLIAAALFVSVVSDATTASAQTSVPLFTTTYEIQIEWSYWQNPQPSWMTIDTFDDRDEAEFMLALYELALEQDQLGEILGISGLYVIFDVRLRTVNEFSDLLLGDSSDLPLRRAIDLEETASKSDAERVEKTSPEEPTRKR